MGLLSCKAVAFAMASLLAFVLAVEGSESATVSVATSFIAVSLTAVLLLVVVLADG